MSGMQRRDYIKELMKRAVSSSDDGEELTPSRVLKLLYGYLEEDTRDQPAYLDAVATSAWVQSILGRAIYFLDGYDKDGVSAVTTGEESSPEEEDRRSSQALKNIGVTTQDTKVRVRLPKVLRKKGTAVQARHVGRGRIAARVLPDLIQKARERGNISQCVEEGLKLLFAE